MRCTIFFSKSVLVLILFVFGIGLGKTNAQNGPQMTFDSTHHHFGVIKEGKKAIHKYKFENTGNRDLKIEEVKTTCGCTVADYPKEAIPPGGRGKIIVSFDTKHKDGPYVKGVNVHHNGGISNLIVFITVKGEKSKIPEMEIPFEDN
mgnify:CR=1 FL=1